MAGRLPANIVKRSVYDLGDAWQAFFRQPDRGRPKFKSRYKDKPSFTIDKAGPIKIEGDKHQRLNVPRIGKLRLKGNNPYPGAEPAQAAVSQENGKWYAVITYAVPAEQIQRANPVNEVVGVDRGVTKPAVCSDGSIFYLPDVKRLEARRRRYQRRMSRQQGPDRKTRRPSSNRYQVTKSRHAKVTRQLAQVRQNWAHHTSKAIAELGKLVAVEALKTKNMTASAKGNAEKHGKNVKQKAGLNKSILESAWGQLGHYLSYKSLDYIEVPAAYTSQACSRCGCIDKENRKSQSRFSCVGCGFTDNADLNAARNIAALGLAEARGSGASARGGGDVVSRPVKREHGERKAA